MPKETVSAAATPSAPGAASPGTVAASEVPQWQVPDDWQSEPASMMVLAAYKVTSAQGNIAKVSVSSFPGDVGGTLANVNRWRAQVGLAPITAEQLPQETAKLDLADGAAIVVDMTGTDSRSGQPVRLVAAIVPRGGQTWFYKLMGDERVVAAQKEPFLAFVKSAKYTP